MSENVEITAGTGTTIAADDISNVKYQKVKLVDGTADATTMIAAGGGVEAGALRVTIASDSTGVLSVDDNGGALTVDGTVAATQSGTWNVGTVTAVTSITNSVAVTDNSGSLTVDNAGLTALNGAIAGTEVQVDIVGSLPAGTAAIGKLAANSGVDIGDVDILSIAAGDNNIGNVDIVSGTITAVTSITNAVTVAQSTAANLKCEEASASAIKTAVEVIDNAISGSEMQVDVVAALPTGTNIIGAVKRDVVNYTPIRKYYTNAGAVTDGIIWSPASGKKWVLTDLIINVSAAATVTLEEDLTGGDSPVMKLELAANGGISTNFQTPLASGEDDADLIITTSAGNVYVTAIGYEID